MTDDVVDRLLDALVEALDRRPTGDALTVAELYERLVPYREVRSRLGVELIGDYEHALLRLLAGDRGLLRVESPNARAAIRHEAASEFPAVGVFRQYADATVAVTAPAPPTGAAGSEGSAESERSARSEGSERSEGSAGPASSTGSAGHEGFATPERSAGSAGAGPTEGPATPEPDPGSRTGSHPGSSACRFCDRVLPRDRDIRFCPFCGGDQHLRPCPRCDAVVETGWRYCVRCGRDLERG